MADKTKSIKSATDKEIDDLLIRLRKERELQGLVVDIKRMTGDFNEFAPYSSIKVSTEEAIESLYHYGIPGMKWGRRQIKAIQTRRKAKAEKLRAETSEDALKKNQLQSKKIHQLSNADLKTLNNRLQLEKQYRELSKSDLSPGKKFISDLLRNNAKQTANNYTVKYMTKGVEAAINKVI